MSHKTKHPTHRRRKKVTVECRAPEANEIFLAGDFNDWAAEATPLYQIEPGHWIAKLSLPNGRYEFKFVVDGQWCCDPGCRGEGACPRCVPNDFGTMNRVLEVA